MAPPGISTIAEKPVTAGASQKQAPAATPQPDPGLTGPQNTNRLAAIERQTGKAAPLYLNLSNEMKEVLRSLEGLSSFAPSIRQSSQLQMKELLTGPGRAATLKALHEIATTPCAAIDVRKDALTLLYSEDGKRGVDAAIRAGQQSPKMMEPAMLVLTSGTRSDNAQVRNMSEAGLQRLIPPKSIGDVLGEAGTKLQGSAKGFWQTKAMPAMQWTAKAAKAVADWKPPVRESPLDAQSAKAALESGLDPVTFQFIPEKTEKK